MRAFALPTQKIMAVTLSRRVSAFLAAALACIALAAPAAQPVDRYFRASDGARLHYVETGRGPTLVFVPGWTMPADIWAAQIRHFSSRNRVIAFDPRGQGMSEVTGAGYTIERRAEDIRELIAQLGTEPVVLIGWSLGVLESLAYTRFSGPDRLRALVLVDNSIGEEPPPVSDPTFLKRLRQNRRSVTEGFVRNMFRTPRSDAYLDRITRSALQMPTGAAVALLSYPMPRDYWKQAVYAFERPLLYVVTERFRGQAENLKKNRPRAWVEIFEHAGHALFVDEAERFNDLLGAFLARETETAITGH
jgi:non-heme chloroperoxidase